MQLGRHAPAQVNLIATALEIASRELVKASPPPPPKGKILILALKFYSKFWLG